MVSENGAHCTHGARKQAQPSPCFLQSFKQPFWSSKSPDSQSFQFGSSESLCIGYWFRFAQVGQCANALLRIGQNFRFFDDLRASRPGPMNSHMRSNREGQHPGFEARSGVHWRNSIYSSLQRPRPRHSQVQCRGLRLTECTKHSSRAWWSYHWEEDLPNSTQSWTLTTVPGWLENQWQRVPKDSERRCA